VVAKNHCMMILRKPTREIFTETFVEKNDIVHLEDAREKEQMLQQLESAIQTLTKEQKICVELFYIQEKSYKEIEAATGYDYNKVKSYIQNGKRNLQQKLNKIIFVLLVTLTWIFLHG
jgi:RNA polymerase sigma-70 factor (ECF subfamily)